MKHSSQTDPNAPRRRSRKRRNPSAHAADLQARRTHAFAEVHEDAAPLSDETSPEYDPVARRERRRRRVIRKSLRPQSLQMWLVLIAVALVSVPALRKMYIIHADYRWLQAQVDFKEEQLSSLREQNKVAQRRLAVLTSDKGREQLLIENGYVPPGSRILLFPPDPEEKRAAEIPKNDLSPHPPSSEDNSNGSFLHQTGKAIGDLWRGLSGSGGAENTDAKQVP